MRYKRFNSILDIVQRDIKDIVKENDIVVDCTLGNGHDAMNLIKRIGPNGKLYGFDIQEEAIENTEKRLACYTNYELFLAGHENINKYIKEKIDFAIYNLGYLPGGNKSITTKYLTTIESIKKTLDLLKPNGNMIIVAYPGHRNGLEEKIKVEELLKNINQKKYNILKKEFINQINYPPVMYLVEKNNII